MKTGSVEMDSDLMICEYLPVKLELKYEWNNLMLADNKISQLRGICEFVRHGKEAISGYGFETGRSPGIGVVVLFSGPPGTGKTMAASIIARELSMDLYRIDLSMVVSKYIGETEKNLSQIFDKAESTEVILYFDEADALFGKRSEVCDAHDRYNNIEISYLLERMEAYSGLSILASNRKQDIDDAFLRRLRYVVDFPFPDAGQRRRIWEGAFPAGTPLGEDVDFSVLARGLRVSGESIVKIAHLATSYATNDEAPAVTMKHIIQAAKEECEITGLPWRWPPPRLTQGR